jgi:hypothetical protein
MAAISEVRAFSDQSETLSFLFGEQFHALVGTALYSGQKYKIDFDERKSDPGAPINRMPQFVTHGKMQLDRAELFGGKTPRKL